MDHRTDLSITDMVYNRLPFLADTVNNDNLISMYILEVMLELEICFKIDATRPEGETTSWVGDESKYSLLQRVIVADMTAVQLLMMKIVSSVAGESDGTDDATGSVKYLKKAKAGSVEVEWDQVDTKKGGGLSTSAETLLKMYQDAVTRRSGQLQCQIMFTPTGCEISCLCTKEVALFRIVAWGCDETRSVNPAERA